MTKRLALENVRMVAARETNRIRSGKGSDERTMEAWAHVLRFCEEARIRGSILRTELPEGT